jgi:hypothetical protein
LSVEQKFTKTITEDNIGKQLYAAMKAAPDAVPQQPATYEQFGKAVADAMGEAHARMHSLAVDAQRTTGRTYQQSYARVYSAPENERLRNKVKAEHLAATLRGVGDTAYDSHNPPRGRERGGQVQT